MSAELRLHATLVSVAKVMRCIQCSLVVVVVVVVVVVATAAVAVVVVVVVELAATPMCMYRH